MREQLIKELCPKGVDPDEFATIIFHRPTGIRLKYKGYLFFKKNFDCHVFPIIKKELVGRDYKVLHKEMKYPYYVATEAIAVFSKQDAFLFKLHGGVRDWLDSFR